MENSDKEMSVPTLRPDAVGDQNQLIERRKFIKIKRCSCTVDSGGCAFHPTSGSGDGLKEANKVSRPMQEKSTKKQEKLKRDNLKSRLPIRVTTKESICSGTKQGDDRKQNCQINCGNSNKIIPSNTKYSNDSIGKNEQSNLVEPPSVDKLKSEKASCKGGDPPHNESFSSSSRMNVKKSDKEFTNNSNESRRGLTSLTSFSKSEKETIKQWLTKKAEERRIQRIKKAEEEREEMEEKKALERRRESYNKWLENKQTIECLNTIEKLNKELEAESPIIAKKRQEMKKLEIQAKYEAWLMKKQREEKEKKRLEELKKRQAEVDKEERTAANEKAYQDWLKSSRNKPKPIPSNKGLDSLRSCSSIKYVNPVPWVPNIDEGARSHEINEKE